MSNEMKILALEIRRDKLAARAMEFEYYQKD